MSRLRRKEGKGVSQNDVLFSSTESDKRDVETWTLFGFLGKLMKKLVLFLCVLYCLVFVLVYTSLTVRRQVVYLNYMVSPFINFADPAKYDLSNTRNFYIQGGDGKLGVWHVAAKGSASLDDGKPVVLYMHGNGYSRAAKHRISHYKVLSLLGCHVISFDYRGFGDSDGTPTEQGLTDDSLAIFQWISGNTNHTQVFLWGHSLGAAVAIALSKTLTETDVSVSGLILEAPFNNMKDGAYHHPLAKPYRFLPFFRDSLQEINGMFKSDEKISGVKYDLLILHDHGDKIVDFSLGKKLYEEALKHKRKNQVIEFYDFHDFGHNTLYASQDLPDILRKFMKLGTTEQ